MRQLANLLERALILSEAGRLGVTELKPLLASAVGQSDKESLRQALLEAEGDKKRAAAALGISYRAILRKIRAHDLEGFPRYRD